jgi:hypothetical protein
MVQFSISSNDETILNVNQICQKIDMREEIRI